MGAAESSPRARRLTLTEQMQEQRRFMFANELLVELLGCFDPQAARAHARRLEAEIAPVVLESRRPTSFTRRSEQ